MLRWCALGAATAVAACSGGDDRHAATTTTTPSRPSTTAAPTTVAPRPLSWAKLRGDLSGRLVLPTDPSYRVDRRSYDPRFDGARPAAIAFCANATDVQRCLDFARAGDVPFTARSGGHSYGGYSTTKGLVIDVTAMNGVSASGGRARVGAGTRLIDVYSGLNRQGVSIPAGSCPTVGIAGLALGGGIGVVARRYGLTCDAMSSVQVVTADSRVVTADTEHDDDLFWACRGGGGGNFGIATEFGFETFPTRAVTLFTLHWPWAAAADVLAAWMSWIGDTPDELWSNCIIESRTNPPTPVLEVAGIWVGPASEVSPQLDRLVARVGTRPSSRFLETTPLAHAMYVEAGCSKLSESECHLPGQTAPGRLGRKPTIAASNFVDGPLSDAGVDAVVAGIAERIEARRPGAIAFDSYGGAVNRVPAAATAFVHRNSLGAAQYSVTYELADSAADQAGHRAWLDRYGRALAPFVSAAAYQNYIDPTLSDPLPAYYGTNLPRLRTVKKHWDPDNTFHFAQSIPLP